VRRHILGLIALASFAWAAIPYCYPPLSTYEAAGSMGLRIGILLGAFWLAWPELHRMPRWVWFALPIGYVVLWYARGRMVFLIPALVSATVFYLLYRRLWRSR
jgi:hypothetical protein